VTAPDLSLAPIPAPALAGVDLTMPGWDDPDVTECATCSISGGTSDGNRSLPSTTGGGVDLRNGAVAMPKCDLNSKASGLSLLVPRTYSSRTSGSGTMGSKWLSGTVDYRLVQEGASDVAVITDATSKRVFTMNMGTYTGPSDSPLTLQRDTMNYQFILTDWRTGAVNIFHDFSTSAPGRLKEETTLDWRAAGREGTLYTYTNSVLTQVTTPDGQDYNQVFSYTGTKLTKLELRTGATTATRFKVVDYTYFNSYEHSADLGSDGDLIQVKTSALKTGGNPDTAGDWVVRYEQYRYGSYGLLKAVYKNDAIARLVADRADINTAADILTKGDDDDNSGAAAHRIKDYASQQYTYYTTDVKTDNTGAGTAQDPKCVTVWAPSGENLQSKYGGTDADEVDSATGKYLVKSVSSGGCASCGGTSGGITREYFYMQLDHGTSDSNEVVWLVVEDMKDASGNGIRRTVRGTNDAGGLLREVVITDPCGTPAFWCQSKKLVVDTGTKLNCIEESRSPAAHSVTSSTVDEFLNPSHNGDFANDTSTLQASTGLIRVFEYTSDGDVSGQKIKQGRSGTAYYVSATDYLGGTNANQKHLVTYQYVFPQAETSRTAATRIATQYSYTFWTGTDTIQTLTATYPTVASTENGSGYPTSSVNYYDNRGRLRWQKDPLGYVIYYSYHPVNGKTAYIVRDADPNALPSSADAAGNASKWVPSSNGSASSNKPTRGGGLPTALKQVEFNEFDLQARVELTATEDGTSGAILARHYSVYELNRHVRFPYWNTINNQPFLPIEVTVFDDAGTVTDQYAVDPTRTASSGGKPTGLSAGTDQTHYVRWTRPVYDAVTGEVTATHDYFDIPASGYGTKDTNYTESLVSYDAQGRRDRSVSPGGTISRTVFDTLGRVSSQWIGTDDTPSSGSWSPSNNSGANMTKVAQFEFDGGATGGNGNQTKVIRYLTDDVEANARVTKMKYDWRDRQVFVVDAEEYASKVTYSRVELDNLGRTTKSERYYDADDDESFPTDGTVDAGDRLLARSENLYDKMGRVYRTKTYAVNSTTGAVGSALVSDTWLDAAGHTLKQQGASSDAFSKMVYDGLGRVTKQYTAYDTDETAYTDADDVTGDTVLEQSVVTYDVNGNAIQTTSYQRKHTEAGTGELTTSSARVTYAASWFDGANRTTASANYGTNGGAAFSRPSSAPASSDTVLVTSTEYNTAGQAYKTIDPLGKESRVEFDDAGRTTKQIGSYVDGNPATGGSDEDVTVEMAYNADGQVTTLTAKNPTTGDQITKYVYGTSVGGITPEAYRNDLLRSEIYPDSDDTTSLGNGADGTYDRIEFTYDIQGGRLDRKDQNGTVHTYDIDKAGRVTHDRVTTLGTGVDGTVRRVSTTYEIRGLREKITTYDNATVGSGTALTELVYEYNDLGMPTKEYQEHEGVKDASTLYVGYNYDTTVASGEYTKGLRPTSVRYPSSRLVHLTYGTTGANGDALGRVESIKDDSGGSPGTSFSDYFYLGSGTIVVEDYAQPDVKLNYDSGTAGTYAGFDRFGRVVDQLWYDYGASADRDRFTYGYDRASSRLYRENAVASAKDEYYTYDDVNRLATFDRGDLDAGKTAISGTPVKEEDWALDMTGNWTDFLQKTSGTTDLNQDRAHNPVNEITGITETVGTAWVDPVHDQAGNMTTMPKPSGLNTALTCTWDAWNRLVEVKQGAVVMGHYEYDALGRRVKSHVDSQSPGSPNGVDAYVHYFYNSGWQELESRVSASENTGPESLQPTYQYVWSRRYIDAPVLRDKNTDADGLCDDERIYYLGDANFNITTLVNTAGDAIERYVYTPYGVLTVYDATWANIRSTSSYANAYTYTGRQLDAETGLYYYRARLYSPQLGRFVSRDSIGYGDSYSLYHAVFVPNDTDPTGELRFSLANPSYRKCGGLEHTVRWILDKGEEDGIILQKICYSENVFTCKDKGEPECQTLNINCANTRTCNSQCYLEAWRVTKKGRNRFTDTFWFPTCRKSWGYHFQWGTAIFVPTEWGRQHTEFGGVLGNGQGGVARACDLPSACMEDPQAEQFWSQAVQAFGGSMTIRASFTAWCCCGDSNRNLLEFSFALPHFRKPALDTLRAI
jgi:RHS repeat-associated protein